MTMTTSISRKDFMELSKIRHPHCVSLYLPTTQADTSDKDMIMLKDLLKEARSELRKYELTRDEVAEILKPAEPLLESSSGWRGLSNGMALFIYENQMRQLKTPLHFARRVHISDTLYLLPLVNLVDRVWDFYVLRLSMNEAMLFECDGKGIRQVDTGQLVPESLADVVGHDYEQKSLQYRSGQQAEGEGAFYHGHGSGDEKELKEEVTRFVRMVSEGIDQCLKGEDKLLVVACVDYLFPMYRTASEYPHLFEKPLTGNYEEEHPKHLRDHAISLLGDHWELQLHTQRERFHDLLHRKEASYMTNEIIKASYGGGVDTLFVLKDQQLMGTYDPQNDTLNIHDNRGSEELLNFAALHTIKNGGRVFYCEEQQMPEPSQLVNAVYRYPH